MPTLNPQLKLQVNVKEHSSRRQSAIGRALQAEWVYQTMHAYKIGDKEALLFTGSAPLSKLTKPGAARLFSKINHIVIEANGAPCKVNCSLDLVHS